MNTCYVIGSGPSIHDFDLAGVDDHICAVSSGINVVLRSPEHFVAMDHPRHFNADLFTDPMVCKHVVNDEWNQHLNLRKYELRINCQHPMYGIGPIADGDLGIHYRRAGELETMVTGRYPTLAGIFNNSLLMAVQVLPRMGYDRLVFAGCDLNDPHLHPVAEVLRVWHQAALKWGVEWFNASPASRLAGFLPSMEAVTV